MTNEELQKRGLALGIGAYLIWGVLPIYFKVLSHVPPIEMVTDRVVASLLLMLALLVVRRELPELWRNLRDRRTVLPMVASAFTLSGNWLLTIYAAVHNHFLAVSLSGFLSPLIYVAMGVVLLKERLNRTQIVAVAIACCGVALMAVSALDTLWFSLVLALSAGLYILIRKVAPAGSVQGLALETVILTPLSIIYIVYAMANGQLVFGQATGTSLLVAGLGVATCVPLLMFATSARIVSLTTLGLMQYIAPTIIFLTGWLVYDEPLNSRKVISFAVIWLALAIFTWDSLRPKKAVRTA